MNKQLSSKSQEFSWPLETIATSFVVFFILLGLFMTFSLVAVKVQTQSIGNPSQWRVVFNSMVLGCGGLGGTLLVAPFLGWLCSLPFMRRTVKEAVPAAVVLREFGLQDDDVLMGFIRQHKLTVYRTKNRLPDAIAYDVPALQEPLFALWVYFPLLPSRFFGKKTICFDHTQVEPLKKLYLHSLASAMPETIQAVSDEEKNVLIEALQMQVQEFRDMSATERRELKNGSL